MVSIGRLPGGDGAAARGMSADGAVIVGESTVNANGDTHAFRWTASGGMVDLGVLAGDTRSQAKAVSANGSIVVGLSRNGFSSPRAFIWDAVNGMRDRKSVLVAGNPNLSNWTLRTANSISADGKTIAGDAINPLGTAEGYSAQLNSVIAVTDFFPASGVPGTVVTISGQRFVDAASVRFNGLNASFTADSDEQVTATVPAGAGSGPISVSNPNDSANSGASFTVLADSDQDGMSDAFELQYFGSATGGNPNADSDGDALTNLQEYQAGTNPLDPSSRLRITEIRKQGADVVIVFPASAQKRYVVEASTDLANGFTIPVATVGPFSSAGLQEVTESGAPASTRRFYRVRLLQ